MTSNLLTPQEVNQRAAQIKLLLLDVDGVLTDGRLYFGNNGEEFKSFSTLDGQGMKALQKSGVKVGIITGRTSHLVARRASDLGIEILVQGREDKWEALQEILQSHSYELSEIAFMGDDWPDLSVMTRVGLALTVANAHTSVATRAHWQSRERGGEGAVRAACDLIMQAQGTFDAALAPYLANHGKD
ncbi:KdsC family phosphatase [Cellvibrio sp. NN19]|uniref:KdsC family phosphatase n=1 Tax=Cellvibrio chitinivorans TaxID=3102792 RepID=UPI002B411531|nr:HAD hydrolase family protein [Cellvibrio sp. NN19]